MTNKFEKFKADIKDKSVAVIGIGISNRPLVELLIKCGAKVTVRDSKARAALEELARDYESRGVVCVFGDDYMQNITEDVIFKTPGMRFDRPELVAAKENGSVITSEMEVFIDVCPSHMIAVTGSDGKTTTTTLINELMTKSGYKTWLGGNIGKPLLDQTDKMSPDDWVILELSSFQLHTIRKSPEIAVITNLSPNHLDVHKSYDEYKDAKKNIFLYQNENDLLVTNMACSDTAALVGEAKGRVCLFSRDKKSNIKLENGIITVDNKPILAVSDIKIPGLHNVENYMAAIGAVSGMVTSETITEVAKSFGGVEHRIELVRVKDGVSYYNSSIDSSPNRTINTLAVFDKKVIMIAGGKDKGISYDEIGEPIVNKVKKLILCGMTADVIEAAVVATGRTDEVEILRADDYQQAVELAACGAQDGDIVLLSPASTSFDRFANFEERGRVFKAIVNSL